VALALLWVFVENHGATLGFANLSRRGSFVVPFALFQLVIIAVTEGTSVGHHFSAGVVIGTWCVLIGVGIVSLLSDIKDGVSTLLSRIRAGTWWRSHHPFSVDEWVGTVVIAVFFGVLVLIGWLYPPSNADAMAYHLARVEHWIQNHSIAPYAAHFTAQIELGPLQEYNLATLHLFTGGDRLDGYVQLLAALICVIGASDLARQLGLSRRAQIFTGLVVMTIPNLVLEATSTTNDDFAAAISVTAVIILCGPLSRSGWLSRGIAVGLAVGLVELAKGTLFGLVGPLMLAIVLVAIWRTTRRAGGQMALRRLLGGVVGVVAIAGLVAGPFVVQNVEVFGGPTGPVSKGTISDDLTIRAGAANVVRSAAAEFLIGNGHDVESLVSRGVIGTLKPIFDSLDVRPNNNNYELGTNPDPFKVVDFSVLNRFEDVGADPWQVVLIVVTMVVFLYAAVRRRKESYLPLLPSAALCCGFVLFTATAKWSIFAPRYYIPLLVLWSPLIAFALRKCHLMLVRVIAVLLVLTCMPQLVDNYSRSLIHPAFHFTSPLEPYFVFF
jgi:hypothetical protein